MYAFVCSSTPSHTSYSAAREGKALSCPQCGASTMLEKMTEEMTIWFPGIYSGREGVYTRKVADIPLIELTGLVQRRAHEDGEWAIETGHVGDNEDVMRKMITWVSDPTNIQQCVNHIFKQGEEDERTVDWLCRDMANASKWLGGFSD